MRKKLIWVVSLLLVFAVICSCTIYKTIHMQKRQENYNNAFIELFVTERNEVFLLYETIGSTIENPSQENYKKALDVAIKTENVCCETYGKLSDIVPTYGAGLVYYATFYRDIKTLLSSSCEKKELNNIYELLEEIISLYDYGIFISSLSHVFRQGRRIVPSVFPLPHLSVGGTRGPSARAGDRFCL